MLVIEIKHHFIDFDLLIDPGDHHRLVDRLILSSDIVPIKIHIQIIHVFYLQKRLKHINIVHIKGFLRQLQTAFAQKLCPENHRMHQDILSLHKMFHIFPGKQLIFWQRMAVPHHFMTLLPCFFVDKIADQHIEHRP